jgi:hypothetical protein
MTYVANLVGSVSPFQASGSLKPTAMGTDPSEPAVSPETANRRMSSNMSGLLSDKPDGTSISAQVTNVPIRPPSLFQVSVTPVPSWPGCGRLALAV